MDNPVVSQPMFQRAMRVIQSITNANPAVVTTTTDHQYIDGMQIRFRIPKGFGMQQIDGVNATVTRLSATTFSVNVDTTNMDSFNALIDLGTTDGSGNKSGTVVTGYKRLLRGQFFIIGSQVCMIVSRESDLSGPMYCSEDASGTFELDFVFDEEVGDYTITGAAANTTVYYNLVPYPLGYQYAQVVPTGESNSMFDAATYNVEGTDFYS